MENAGKYVLITGATSGIGLELAKLFAKNQYNLILVARQEEDLRITKARLQQNGTDIKILAKDLFDPQHAFDLYEEVKQMGVQVSILVNNAGQGHYGEFVETDIKRELEIIDLNIKSLVILTKCFVTDMIARREGKILNLASIASKVPGPWQAVYHGTKAFVLSFSEGIREELKDTGITVTALLPGATDTDFFNKADMNESKILEVKDNLSDPAKVAKDGYDALMAGEDQVISGFKNKLQMAMNTITSDKSSAHQMHEQQKPVDHD